MSNVNRVPRGLLAYLDSQTQGENPSSMSEVVAPVLDMERFYRANARYETAGGGASFDALNDNVTATVPGGETWHVLLVSGCIQNSSGATATIGASLNVGLPGSLANEYLNLNTINQAMLDNTFRRIHWDGVLVLTSGMFLRFTVDQPPSVAGFTGTMTFLYNRLQS